MQLTLEKSQWMPIIQSAAKLAHGPLPVLSNVLLKAEQGHLILTATDLEVGLAQQVNVETGKGVTEVALPAKTLSALFEKLPDGPITIEAKDKKLKISHAAGTAHINGIDPSEFPVLPTIPPPLWTAPQALIKGLLRQTAFALSKERMSQVLNGVLLSIAAPLKVTCVATDRRRIAIASGELPAPVVLTKRWLLPEKTVQQLQRILSEDGMISCAAIGDHQVAFMVNGTTVVSRLLDEQNFPAYDKFLALQPPQRATVNRQLFSESVSRAAVFSTSAAPAVRLALSPGHVTVSKTMPDGEINETLESDYAGEPFHVAFDPTILMDGLSIMEQEQVVLECDTDLKPAVVREGGFMYLMSQIQEATPMVGRV